jgi:hypothetical protein
VLEFCKVYMHHGCQGARDTMMAQPSARGLHWKGVRPDDALCCWI